MSTLRKNQSESCSFKVSHIVRTEECMLCGLITEYWWVFSVCRLISSGSCMRRWSTISMMMSWPNLEPFWLRAFWMQVSTAPLFYLFIFFLSPFFFFFLLHTKLPVLMLTLLQFCLLFLSQLVMIKNKRVKYCEIALTWILLNCSLISNLTLISLKMMFVYYFIIKRCTFFFLTKSFIGLTGSHPVNP